MPALGVDGQTTRKGGQPGKKSLLGKNRLDFTQGAGPYMVPLIT